MSQLFADLMQGKRGPVVPGPTVDGRMNIGPKCNYSSSSEDEDPCEDYAKKFIQQEMKLYSECYKDESRGNGGITLNVDDITRELAGSDIRSEVYQMARRPEIYSKYNFETSIPKKNLAILGCREKILSVIKANSVVVIDGPTGCGKTTQVPQYILDDCRAHQKECNIVITQPRKIATINVAKRVCQERGWALGTICGYQVGLEKELGPDVILSYMTTGVLLQKLIHSKSLNEYTHIIVDEVHERNQDLDFLLLVIRKLLFTKSFNTRVILMSATINTEDFAHYFRYQYKGDDFQAPVVYINEPNQFAITKYFLDNLPPSLPTAHFDIDKPEICEGVINVFLFLLTAFNKLDEADPFTNETRLGSVLVFLPGIREIEDIEKLLIEKQLQWNSTSENDSKMKWEIIPLHSSLPNDEQARAFKPVAPPYRKIILSTNIAESSITVPDISYVIDFCLTKNMVVDKDTKFASLRLEWASHVNCEQRAGRAGRVSNGRVYRLVNRIFYERFMDKESTPEILRAPLESVTLQAKMLDFNEEPKAILALAINPPNLSNIEKTVLRLKEIGALLDTCKGRKNISDGDITYLGTVMASLPMDVCFSKLIVLGHMFSVLHEAIIIAAGCSIPNIFSTPFNQRFQAYNKKLLWADGSCSDLMALLNLYKVWQACRRDGAFKQPREEFAWCKANLVSLKGLREWQLLISEIQSRLRKLGIEETSGPARVNLSSRERVIILKVIICGAFYPHYFIRSAAHGQIDEREAVRTVGGRDPCKTVYLMGMDPGQPISLYSEEIKKMLGLKEDCKVESDGTSKIFIEFKNYKQPETVYVDGQQCVTTIPGKIAMDVYHAVKRRTMKVPLTLNILPKDLAWDHLANLEKQHAKGSKSNNINSSSDKEADNESTLNCFSQIEYNPFPSLDTEYMTVVISHRIDAGHFFCQNVNDGTQEMLEDINGWLNSRPLTEVNIKTIKNDEIYASKYKKDGQFYRAKIHMRLSETEAQVLFVDYGNIETVKLRNLCKLPDIPILNIAPLAVECTLSEVEPTYDYNRAGLWSERTNELFDKKTQNTKLFAKVFSVCDDVIHLELFKTLPSRGSNNRMLSLNQWLINEGHAMKAEESFRSKQNHETRKNILQSGNPHIEAKKLQIDKKKKENICIEANFKGVERYTKQIQLKGPFSPLETKIYSTISHGHNKSVVIEPTSVNSVFLDSDPLDPHTRLIVAGVVNQSSSGDNLLLRQTTVMPNIPGFPYLMALLFCPQMEPKLTEDGSRVSSLLCGLGVVENTRKAQFAAHDMVLTVDTEITEAMINKVNELRYAMNSLLDQIKNIHDLDDNSDRIEPYQRSVKEKIFQLLRFKLKSVKPFYDKFTDYWKNYPIDLEILRPPVKDTNVVWPLHWFIKLRSLDDKSTQIQMNILSLKEMAKKLIPFENTKCDICDEELFTLGAVRNHIISSEHKKKEQDMKILLP
ncbi:hypothetical protein WA026_018618 [Henosepilachna vigintioctopunctata]|uniref:Probable ATP-dependent RNA helicase spindle-E n=1 Tax=Henosepilachna vigintioctopunctata TaxID=420089 RepID=A0AAW1UA73_9CUCU